MITIIAAVLLLLTVTLGMGGGLYEILVIYPGWEHNVDPLTLRAKLQSSGQILAAKRFWPIASPAQVLLSVINIPLAWNHTGGAHVYLLAGAVAVFINRVITFSYFIPVMIRKIMQPETIEAARLQGIVKKWTALSPLRLVFELFAWIMLVVALMHI
ncbi:hypothetical protein [Puia dinghuensis]|uniref:DUF1772 domain-containing protein n=1 Tax=Puia dinghuensis TaxID=1792502 RepID=A0A8J2UFZ3_9BACT|nr:hypothetical protein [Puia dinghuensis]GGB12548.1 hypothetical protein GCM10011511_40240 [Puia dinghuensis]